jgi:hypothetical protein
MCGSKRPINLSNFASVRVCASASAVMLCVAALMNSLCVSAQVCSLFTRLGDLHDQLISFLGQLTEPRFMFSLTLQ